MCACVCVGAPLKEKWIRAFSQLRRRRPCLTEDGLRLKTSTAGDETVLRDRSSDHRSTGRASARARADPDLGPPLLVGCGASLAFLGEGGTWTGSLHRGHVGRVESQRHRHCAWKTWRPWHGSWTRSSPSACMGVMQTGQSPSTAAWGDEDGVASLHPQSPQWRSHRGAAKRGRLANSRLERPSDRFAFDDVKKPGSIWLRTSKPSCEA